MGQTDERTLDSFIDPAAHTKRTVSSVSVGAHWATRTGRSFALRPSVGEIAFNISLHAIRNSAIRSTSHSSLPISDHIPRVTFLITVSFPDVSTCLAAYAKLSLTVMIISGVTRVLGAPEFCFFWGGANGARNESAMQWSITNA